MLQKIGEQHLREILKKMPALLFYTFIDVELREQLAVEQFETYFFIGISWGQRIFRGVRSIIPSAGFNLWVRIVGEKVGKLIVSDRRICQNDSIAGVKFSGNQNSKEKSWKEIGEYVTVHSRHSQNRHFVALRCFAAHFCSLIGAPFVHSCRQIFMRA